MKDALPHFNYRNMQNIQMHYVPIYNLCNHDAINVPICECITLYLLFKKKSITLYPNALRIQMQRMNALRTTCINFFWGTTLKHAWPCTNESAESVRSTIETPPISGGTRNFFYRGQNKKYKIQKKLANVFCILELCILYKSTFKITELKRFSNKILFYLIF